MLPSINRTILKPDPVFQVDVDGGNFQRAGGRLAHSSPLRVIDENDPAESNQSSAMNQQVSNSWARYGVTHKPHNFWLHYVTLHLVMLHYVIVHYIRLHCVMICYITLWYITLHCVTLCRDVLYYILFSYDFVTLCHVLLH